MQNAVQQPHDGSWPHAGDQRTHGSHDAQAQAWVAQLQSEAYASPAPAPGDEQLPMRTAVAVLVIVVAALAALGVSLWLFSGEGTEPAKPKAAAKASFVDGTMTVVEDDRLVMKTFSPVDGKTELEFVVRPEDLPNFDMAHLKSHSAVALPTRIFYERKDGKLYALYKEDAPANSKPAATGS